MERFLKNDCYPKDLFVKRRNRPLFKVVLTLLGFSSIFCAVLAIGCGSLLRRALETGGYVENWNPETDGEKLEDVNYGPESWQVMDVYVPKGFNSSEMRGAVVFIHGGAWIGGSRDLEDGFARRAAKAGYLTANIEYMLASESVKDSYSMERVLDDVDAAIAKLKEIGEGLGCELDRVALSGHSAGGHISSLYAYSRGQSAQLTVAFIMARAAPVDFHVDTWSPQSSPKVVAASVRGMTRVEVDEALALNPDEATEAAINSISPLSYVKPGVTPTISAYGAKDSIVPPNHPRKLRAAFEAIGAKPFADRDAVDLETPIFDYVEFPHSDHMLTSDGDCTTRLWDLFLAYSKHYLLKPEEHGDVLNE